MLRRGLGIAVLGVLGLLATPAPGQAAAVQVELSTDISDGSTRLVLSHSRYVDYQLRPSESRIEVIYANTVGLTPPALEFDDEIIARYEMKDDRTLVLHMGPGYRKFESFALRNPFRLVLDLQGKRPRRAKDRARAKPRAPQTIIVLDPGHGGVEIGAIGPTGLREKDVTLDLARRLKQALADDRSIAVVLTRDEDRLIGLDERTAIANHNRANLFVSIHLNSSPRSNAIGAETYFLSTDATDDEARTLAALENRSHGVDKDRMAGTKSSLELVLWDLAQNQFLAESSLLGERMQSQLNRLAQTRDRGVRQAPFRVLMGATMPAILVEVGFISNPHEETRFKSLGYRNQIVSAMANAVREFLRDLERLSAPASAGAGR